MRKNRERVEKGRKERKEPEEERMGERKRRECRGHAGIGRHRGQRRIGTEVKTG